MDRVYVPCINLTDLIAYTEWQREKWQAFLRAHRETLQTSAGPNGDGRFTTVGDLVRHIFSAEKRYIDRLSNSPLTDPAAIPSNDVEALFALGRQSRDGLIAFLKSFPDSDWDASQEHTLLNHKVRLTPRKIVLHVVLHEIHHWAQIATLLRLTGTKTEFQDFIGSPVLGARTLVKVSAWLVIPTCMEFAVLGGNNICHARQICLIH